MTAKDLEDISDKLSNVLNKVHRLQSSSIADASSAAESHDSENLREVVKEREQLKIQVGQLLLEKDELKEENTQLRLQVEGMNSRQNDHERLMAELRQEIDYLTETNQEITEALDQSRWDSLQLQDDINSSKGKIDDLQRVIVKLTEDITFNLKKRVEYLDSGFNGQFSGKQQNGPTIVCKFNRVLWKTGAPFEGGNNGYHSIFGWNRIFSKIGNMPSPYVIMASDKWNYCSFRFYLKFDGDFLAIGFITLNEPINKNVGGTCKSVSVVLSKRNCQLGEEDDGAISVQWPAINEDITFHRTAIDFESVNNFMRQGRPNVILKFHG